jgi:hypothetical protein
MNLRYISMIFLALALLVALTSCGVTETGNPLPQPSIGDLSEAAAPYVNETYGVTVHYPSGWMALGDRSGESVEFTDGVTQGATVAVMKFVFLDPEPESLLAYLKDEYPNRTFIIHNTSTLSGYFYDDPMPGDNGGNAREYFFMAGGVLITIDAETFESGREDFLALLEGISFE